MRQKGIVHLFLLIVIVIVVMGVLGYLAYQNARLREGANDISAIQKAADVTITTTPAAEESVAINTPTTSGWKTYYNMSGNYSIHYPPGWKVLNFGLIDAEPADEHTRYVRFSHQPDLSESDIGFDIEVSDEIDISEEISFNEVRTIGSEEATCGSTGDGKTSFCWLKTSDENNYLIFTISNYQKSEHNTAVNQILSTFKLTE